MLQRNKSSHNIKRINISDLVTVFLAAALLFAAVYPQEKAGVYALSGLDESIALDMVQSGSSAGSSDQTDNATPEPLLEAGPGTFAEALAQEYSPQDGEFLLSEDSRFYIDSKDRPDPDVTDTLRLMDSLFASYELPTSEPLTIVYGESRFARSGDIVISIVSADKFIPGTETADPEQSYKLYIDDKVTIEACSTDGLWYGLTELMELAREKQAADVSEISDTAADRIEMDPLQERADSAVKKSIVLDGMRIKDGPDLKERALMLDCGRKYYSKEWIENLIRRASLQRYNALIIHFAEAEGIRLDSEVFPWLTEDIESLSTDDMREIVELAHSYHIEVIPSFDTPGHNRFMVEKYASHVKSHPDFSFTYDGVTYDCGRKKNKSIANHYSYGGETEKADYIGIDLTKKHAVAFTNALIEGYADFFRGLGCRKFDIGSDELLGWYTFRLGGELINYDNRWTALEHWDRYARKTLGIKRGSASDVLISYINDLAGRLENKGYTCRVFNDEIDINPNQHVELKESIEITYWLDDDNTAGHYADKGHVVHNFMESWCFYVLREKKGRDIMENKYKTVNGRNIFENWDPRSFARKAGKKMTVPEDKLGGGYFAIWCDTPDYKDAETVWKETELRTWANASKMWNAEVNSDRSGIRNAASYEDMEAFASEMEDFPGYTGTPSAEAELIEAPAITKISLTKWQRFMEEVRSSEGE